MDNKVVQEATDSRKILQVLARQMAGEAKPKPSAPRDDGWRIHEEKSKAACAHVHGLIRADAARALKRFFADPNNTGATVEVGGGSSRHSFYFTLPDVAISDSVGIVLCDLSTYFFARPLLEAYRVHKCSRKVAAHVIKAEPHVANVLGGLRYGYGRKVSAEQLAAERWGWLRPLLSTLESNPTAKKAVVHEMQRSLVFAGVDDLRFCLSQPESLEEHFVANLTHTLVKQAIRGPKRKLAAEFFDMLVHAAEMPALLSGVKFAFSCLRGSGISPEQIDEFLAKRGMGFAAIPVKDAMLIATPKFCVERWSDAQRQLALVEVLSHDQDYLVRPMSRMGQELLKQGTRLSGDQIQAIKQKWPGRIDSYEQAVQVLDDPLLQRPARRARRS
jgi:hypothetical protein